MEMKKTEVVKDRRVRLVRVVPLIMGLVILDQLTKLWALSWLRLHGPVPIIKNVLEFLYVENRGAAFGILQNKQWFFLIITVLILAGVVWLLYRVPGSRHFLPLRLCGYFIIAGALGNMIDRIYRHFVVDFIYFKLIDFPVFNVADIYVTVSAFSLAALILFYYKGTEIDDLFSGHGECK